MFLAWKNANASLAARAFWRTSSEAFPPPTEPMARSAAKTATAMAARDRNRSRSRTGTSSPASKRSVGSMDDDVVADPDPARALHVGQDTHIGVLAFPQALVRDDRPERVEVALAGIGVLGRDGAAGVELRDPQDRVPDADALAD